MGRALQSEALFVSPFLFLVAAFFLSAHYSSSSPLNDINLGLGLPPLLLSLLLVSTRSPNLALPIFELFTFAFYTTAHNHPPYLPQLSFAGLTIAASLSKLSLSSVRSSLPSLLHNSCLAGLAIFWVARVGDPAVFVHFVSSLTPPLALPSLLRSLDCRPGFVAPAQLASSYLFFLASRELGPYSIGFDGLRTLAYPAVTWADLHADQPGPEYYFSVSLTTSLFLLFCAHGCFYWRAVVDMLRELHTLLAHSPRPRPPRPPPPPEAAREATAKRIYK
jgi:hypothetical protein